MNDKNANEAYVALLQAKEKVARYCREKVKNKAWQPYHNGIVEQLEDPAEAKGIVERDVIQIITPGARMDLATDENNYIVCLDETDLNYVLAFADISTGEVSVMNVEKDLTSLVSELDNLLTREIIVSSSFSSTLLEDLTTKRKLFYLYN